LQHWQYPANIVLRLSNMYLEAMSAVSGETENQGCDINLEVFYI